jgi:hypothetical protein
MFDNIIIFNVCRPADVRIPCEMRPDKPPIRKIGAFSNRIEKTRNGPSTNMDSLRTREIIFNPACV